MIYEREDIRLMTGYTWGEQPEDGRVIKLNTNENPYPPSPNVGTALSALDADVLRRYPNPTADRLRSAIAERHGLTMDQLVMTNGGDEALRLALTTFVNRGEPFGMAEPSYSLYSTLAAIQGAQVVTVPIGDDWRLPLDFARAMNAQEVRLTCVVNPHAPSGVLLDTETIGRLANDLNGVLLVDEAYVDFVDPALRFDALRLVNAFDNLLILRTFSKGYSLAGLRLGYLAGSRGLIDPIVRKTRDSYNLNTISQTLGLAAFEDRAYAEDTWRRVREARREMRQALVDLGFDVVASQTNFLLAEVPASMTPSADVIYRELKAAGILVRYFGATPGSGHTMMEHRLRISIGTPEENKTLLDAIAALVQSPSRS